MSDEKKKSDHEIPKAQVEGVKRSEALSDDELKNVAGGAGSMLSNDGGSGALTQLIAEG